jgi:hypothetical protein
VHTEVIGIVSPPEIIAITEGPDYPTRRTYTSRDLYSLHDQRVTLVAAPPGVITEDGTLHSDVLLTMRDPDVGVVELVRPEGPPVRTERVTRPGVCRPSLRGRRRGRFRLPRLTRTPFGGGAPWPSPFLPSRKEPLWTSGTKT